MALLTILQLKSAVGMRQCLDRIEQHIHNHGHHCHHVRVCFSTSNAIWANRGSVSTPTVARGGAQETRRLGLIVDSGWMP